MLSLAARLAGAGRSGMARAGTVGRSATQQIRSFTRASKPRRWIFTNYEAPGANQGGYQQHAYFSQPMYNLLTSKIYCYWVIVFGIGANMTFLPMHFLGFNTMPRRYNESADACQGWNIMCTQGSMIAVLGVWYLKRY
mmetsp:Transcript_12266/g.29749  ORF Transcript_12266/g.29749 Transcript_12266/m.29749 type:complete len:138 (-) Transcript_12266:265-678(-)